MIEMVTKIIQNSLFSLVASISTRLVGMVLFILISRRMGLVDVEIYWLAFTFTALFTELSFMGLDQLLTREVAKREDLADKYVNNFLAMQLLLALISILLLYILLQTLLHYPQHYVRTIMIMESSVIAESLCNIGYATLIAFREMRYLGSTTLIANTFKLIGGIVALNMNAPLEIIVAVIAITSFIKLLFTITILFRRFVTANLELDWQFLREQFRALKPFVLIVFCYVAEMRLDTILLSLFSPGGAVGIYGAATTIFFAFFILPKAYKDAIFPVFSRLYATDLVALKRLYTQSMRYLFMLILPIVVFISMTASDIVHLLYRRVEFNDAASVLRILIWGLIFVFMMVPSNRLIIAADGQRYIMIFLLTSFTINMSVNLVLIPLCGARGAAMARVASTGFMFFISEWFVRRSFHHNVPWQPFVLIATAGMSMSLTLYVLHGHNIIIRGLFGTSLYLVILIITGSIVARDFNLVRQVIQDYRRLWLHISS